MYNIIVVGDSHTRVFKYCNNKQNLFNFNVIEVPGASAQGAINPNSQTNALNIFMEKIKPNYDKVIIMLGEVDCGFVIWIRALKNNLTIQEQIDNSINNLFNFVKNICNNFKYKNDDIIIAGVILPTIADSTNKKYLSGARSEINVSQHKRTEITLIYNELLKNKCFEYGYCYVEITKHIIDTDNIVKTDFLNKNIYDHHLDNEKTYNLWIECLKNIIN